MKFHVCSIVLLKSISNCGYTEVLFFNIGQESVLLIDFWNGHCPEVISQATPADKIMHIHDYIQVRNEDKFNHLTSSDLGFGRIIC